MGALRATPRAVFQARRDDAFTPGGLLTVGLFRRVSDGMVWAGLAVHRPAVRFLKVDWDRERAASAGRAGRYWPTSALIELAAEWGVTPETVKADFERDPNAPAPVVGEAVRAQSVKVGRQGDRQALPLAVLGDVEAIRADVLQQNAFAEAHDVKGCPPPRWYRQFTETLALDGRWTAVGGGHYQNMPEADRVGLLRIAGEEVAEVDAKASHL